MHRSRHSSRLILAALSAMLAAALVAPFGVSAATAIKLTRIVDGLSGPTQVTNAGDGTNRLFITEQRGTIRVVENGALKSGFFLDIRSKVGTGGERGLLGLAFHPKFETNRQFFVYWTRKDGDILVTRFVANAAGTSASAASGKTLLVIEHSKRSNHNGGAMAFGPDGYLYIGVGDGGGAGDPDRNARNVNRLLGKILRINVNGTGAGPFKRYSNPSGNPYRGRAGLDEIWARGLRNPWRISFDFTTKALWIADVGQGRREEINRLNANVKPGRDLGWNVMEGTTCYRPSACPLAGDTLPVAQYAHSSGNCSITGGYVYRGTKLTGMAGRYVFGDYCSGRIWSIPRTGVGVKLTQHADTSVLITSFGEDEAKELYLVGSGALYRLAT